MQHTHRVPFESLEPAHPRLEPCLTTREVTALLRISNASVRRLVGRRELAFHRVGGLLRFRLRDVKALLEANRTATLAEQHAYDGQEVR